MVSKTNHKKARRRNRGCALEPLFRGTKAALVHDLGVDNRFQDSLRNKEPEPPGYMGSDPRLFKRVVQVLNFDKRVIWPGDTSFEELSEEALTAFKEDQQNYLLPEPLSQRGYRVIQKARRLCTHILGAFSYDSWFDSCSFGRRAAVGLPRSRSYLDERFRRLSGTQSQWAAFDACLARDPHLLRAVIALRAMRKMPRTRTVVDEIKATTVPKSFKAARIIAPDTVLGGYLSRGLGEMIRKRLEKETHINLSKQQDRHRRWARSASKHGHLATIDMSKASDSFTWRHIEQIVPEDWHHALDCVRTRKCNVSGSVIEPRSYMLMGSGHTFPLQTLLFFCLAEATRQLLNGTGKVSVYGDDIIVPIKVADPLIVVLKELGFVINSEKSFYDMPDALRPGHTFFRESCGGDYKGGIDVRPYMPECDLREHRTVPRNEYVAWCHKVINGLLDRWDPCELPVTLSYLLGEVNRMKAKVCFVPAWETDHAGIRHFIPSYLLIGRETSYLKYENSYPTYFRLTFVRPKRKRGINERPYQWYSYFLHRNQSGGVGCPVRKFFQDLYSGRSKQDNDQPSYSLPISLDGEDRKDRKGIYRWKKREPKRY